MADKVKITYYGEKKEKGKWDFIEIDWEKYCEQYKELWANAVLNGYTIPILLNWLVPEEYDLTVQEKLKIKNKVSDKNNEKLKEANKKIRKLENDHANGKAKDKEVKDFLLKELEDFLKSFPQYKELIIKYNDDIIDAI